MWRPSTVHQEFSLVRIYYASCGRPSIRIYRDFPAALTPSRTSKAQKEPQSFVNDKKLPCNSSLSALTIGLVYKEAAFVDPGVLSFLGKHCPGTLVLHDCHAAEKLSLFEVSARQERERKLSRFFALVCEIPPGTQVLRSIETNPSKFSEKKLRDDDTEEKEYVIITGGHRELVSFPALLDKVPPE
jgi:hypothetical protein